MKTRNAGLAVVAACAACLAGCGETTRLNEPAAPTVPIETRTPLATEGRSTAPAAVASGAPQSSVATVDLSGAAGRAGGDGARGGADAAAPPLQNVVYFDFDSTVIKDEYQPMLDGYARLLRAGRGRHLVVEGHTDERGGREYNLALGQKRAAAVVKSLTLLGAGEAQLEAVSFGAERPAVVGNDEAAWSKNRRAELKDR